MEVNELETIVFSALEELKARDVVSLDVRALTTITDYMVICSGTSSRHVKAIADNLVAEVKKAGLQPLGVEGVDSAEWILVDLGSILVHIMQPKVRDFYNLECLWEASPASERTHEV